MHPIPLGERVALAVISDSDLMASYEDDGDVLMLDSRTGEEIEVQGSSRWMASDLCTVTADGEVLLAGGCGDGTVQLREPRTGDQVRVLHGHRERVSAVCQVEAGGSPLLASSSFDGTIRLWNPASGKHIRTFQADGHRPDELCAIGTGPDCVLASVDGREILLWNPANGKRIRTLEGCSASVRSLCAVKTDGLSLLASGESRIDQVEVDRGDIDEDAVDCAVRLWNPASSKHIRIFEGHSGPVTAVCSFSIRNRDLLASASDDKTVRVWDPASSTPILTIPVSYSATSMTWINDSLVIGLDAGVLAIRLEPSQW